MVNSVNSGTAASAGSTIVSSLSGGSGIDNGALIKQLVDLNKAPQAARLESRQTLLETQISDYGLLRSSFATLQTSANSLASRDTFDAKAVSIPTTSLLAITKLESKAVAGDYRLNVEQVAQAQSLSSGTFANANDAVGKGTLTLRFGNWSGDGGGTGGSAGTFAFAVNPEKAGTTITIDDTNNSLTGLRDAINAEGIGVQATIVSDGGGFRLLITAPSGGFNEIELTAEEDSGAAGLARFNFNAVANADESTESLAQEQDGKDAKVRVNGLLLTRESNHLTDVIDGLEFDIFNSSLTETISINISADKNTAETAIRDFVASYNTFLKDVEKLTGFNEELGEFGSLRQDPLAKNLLQTVRSMMTGSVAGVSTGFNSLSTLGIRTEIDGSLKIIEDNTNTDFRAAIDDNFEAVKDLFTPKTSASDTRIDVTAFSGQSIAGSYEVLITQHAEKGKFIGAGDVEFPIDATDPGKTYGFSVEVDGISAAPITLPQKVYDENNRAELAADIQSLINLDPKIKAGRASVTVSFEDNKLVFTSNTYGAASNVSFVASNDMLELGIAADAVGTAGKDVAGTVDGVAAFGFGNVLLPALGSKAEGLSMTIAHGVTEATISFSRGFAGQIDSLINDFLKTSGLIKGREDNITKDIASVKDDTTALDRRSEAFRARLQAQFTAMEAIVRSLNSTSSFLDGLVDRLPFTAKK